jgi:hypothetical protein
VSESQYTCGRAPGHDSPRRGFKELWVPAFTSDSPRCRTGGLATRSYLRRLRLRWLSQDRDSRLA